MKNLAIGFVLGLLIAGTICAYNTMSRITAPSIIAQPSKELKHAETTKLTCKPLVVYRDKVKRDLGLPDATVKDSAQQVVASTQIKASDYPHTISAVANIDSGKVDMFLRQDSLPWLSFDRKGTLGVSWGVQDDGETATRVDASYRLLAVKRLNLGLTGDVSTTGRAFVGGRAWVSF